MYRAAFSILDSHELTVPRILFADGFESGDTTAWSQTASGSFGFNRF